MSSCERRSCRAALVAGDSGTAVLSARGMTAWMSAVGELAPPASRAPTGAAEVASRFASARLRHARAERREVSTTVVRCPASIRSSRC